MTHQPDMLLTELCETYIAENPRLRAEESKSLIRGAVTTFQEFLTRPGTLADLTEKNLVAYTEYRKQLNRSPRTIERELSKLATLGRDAAMRGWREPLRFSVQKCAPHTPTAWSPAEMNAIFAAVETYRGKVGGMPASIVMLAVLRLAYDTGERMTALLAVGWDDIDLKRRWVTFRGETRKGGAKAADNVQRLSRKTVAAINALRDHYVSIGRDERNVFPRNDKGAFYWHLRQVLKSCGLPAGRNCMFHKLRRTHATHLYIAGGDPTQSLGHGSDAMTRGYYLDPKYVRGGYLADLLTGPWGLVARLWRRLKVACGIW